MADISKITLPSGNTYDIKDAVAREMISGGVSFIIAWDGTSVPDVTKIPEGVVVKYNGTNYTGTLDAEDETVQAGAFYLVKSGTTTSGAPSDAYDEYVPVGTTGSKTWEKIGDTQIDLTDVVTGVTLSKQTDTVIGSDATFTITQPSITLSTGSSGDVTVATGGTTKYMAATASGGGAAWNSKDQVTAVTGYSNPSTDTFVKSVSAETNKNLVTTSITGTDGTESVSKVTKTASKLVTTSIPNVTAAGSASTWSFTMGSGDASETLIIGGGNGSAPTLGTAITAATGSVASNGSGSDIVTAVTISDKTVAKAAATATTVATGATSTTGTGDAVVTGVTIGSSASAITALGTPDTDTVIGSDATFTNTQPTISLSAESSSATGRAQFAQSVNTTKLSGTATGANTAWNSKDSVTVLTNSTDVSVTKGNQ